MPPPTPSSTSSPVIVGRWACRGRPSPGERGRRSVKRLNSGRRIERRRSALGGRWFTPRQGLRALEKLVRQDAATSVVMSMDWSVFEDAVEARPSFLEDLLSSGSDERIDDSASSEDLLSRLRSVPVAGPQDVLVSFLQQQVQAVLRLPSTPAPNVGFFDLGMDSLMTVELRNRLNRAFAGEYVASNTVVFDYP